MSQSIRPIRGMNDILPGETDAWQFLEDVVREVLGGYAYREIRMPLVERTELFARSIGEVTDIVEKEMYTFEDRGGESISLRPEGTAGCVRACISNGLIHNQTQRLWYQGPMFRYERPQKGRYRQFHQIGAEAFGLEGPDIDAELILLSARIWRMLGLDDVRLEINSLGTPEARAAYREELREYFRRHEDALDEDSRRRLDTNPMRILDSKVAATREIVEGAPSILDHLDPASRAHFEGLCSLLDTVGLDYEINPRLVRGLDYYTRTVFEWIGSGLGAQDAVCSGGRYDGLVEQLGGRPTPAIGWALGVERLIAMIQDRGLVPEDRSADVYIVHLGAAAEAAAFSLAESVRDRLPGARVMLNAGGGSFKTQLKRADRSGALLALIIGEEEAANSEVSVKSLREASEQTRLHRDEALVRTAELLGVEEEDD